MDIFDLTQFIMGNNSQISLRTTRGIFLIDETGEEKIYHFKPSVYRQTKKWIRKNMLTGSDKFDMRFKIKDRIFYAKIFTYPTFQEILIGEVHDENN